MPDQRPRLANGHDRPGPMPERFTQQTQITALESTTDNRYESLIETFNRMPRRIDVSRFRIVHEPDAATPGDEFHRVLESSKGFHRGCRGLGMSAGNRAHRRRRHHVGDEMGAE